MATHSITRVDQCSRTALLTAIVLTVAVSLVAGQDVNKQPREQIGESLGKPVYRDEIRADDVTLSSELHRLLTVAAGEEYRSQHEKEITPTPTEISAAMKFYDAKHAERMKEQEPGLLHKLKEIDTQLNQTELNNNDRGKLLNVKQLLERQRLPPGESFAYCNEELEDPTTTFTKSMAVAACSSASQIGSFRCEPQMARIT